MRILRPVAALAATLLIAGMLTVAAVETRAPATVVSEFNAAITARDLPRALEYLGPGSVQFVLRPSHTGLGPQQSQTADLRAHWSMIAPVIFSSTRSYAREIEILDTRVEDDIATVWTKTATVRTDEAGSRGDEFTELYVVLRVDGQWKIAAVTDNRRPNDVGLGRP